MAIFARFSLDANRVPVAFDLSSIPARDEVQLPFFIAGFEADDDVFQMVFVAKLSVSDSDSATTTIIKRISVDASDDGQIQSSTNNPTSKTGLFILGLADTGALTTSHVYSVRASIVRDGAEWERTVATGNIVAADVASSNTGDFAAITSLDVIVSVSAAGCQTMTGIGADALLLGLASVGSQIMAGAEASAAIVSLAAAGSQIESGAIALAAPMAILCASNIETDPNYLASLVLWLDGSDLGADTSAISTWTNRTLSGLDATQAVGGNQPTVLATGINGLKAASFNGSTGFLAFAGAAALDWFKNVTGGTLIAVVQANNNGTTRGSAIRVQAGTANVARLGLEAGRTSGLYGGDGRPIDGSAPVPSVLAAGTVTAGVPAIICVVCDFTAGTMTFYVNGANVASASPTNFTPATSNTSSQQILVGAGTSVVGDPWNGLIANEAAYPVTYSRAQLDPVLRRYARRYGITLLP